MMFFRSSQLLCCFLLWFSTSSYGAHVPRKENYVLKSGEEESEFDGGIDGDDEVLDMVPPQTGEVSSLQPGLRVPPDFLEAHYYSLFADLHTAQSANAFRPGHVTKTHTCGWVREVPEDLRDIRYMRPIVPYFYKKYTEAYGIPVVGSEKVPDEALQRACYVLRFLLSDIRLIREKYFRSYGRVAIMADDENLTELPEYGFLPDIYNNMTRGLGAIHLAPVSSAAEENVLCYPTDRYLKEDILIREIALGVYELAAKYEVRDLEEMLEVMYDNALESGWWRDTYAEQSKEAYFGEGIQSFFSVNGYSRSPDGMHNSVNTRTKLMERDVYLYRLLQRLFPCHNNYLKRCSARGHENEQELRMDCYGGHMPSIFPLFF